MNARTVISACRRTVLSGGFALALPLSGIAADNVPPETLSIKAFPDRYVAAGKPFADLAALEAWARPILIRSVWLDFCYPASTTQLLSAVEHVRSAYSGSMQIRTFSPEERGCASATDDARSPSARETIVRGDAGYLVADEFGRGRLP